MAAFIERTQSSQDEIRQLQDSLSSYIDKIANHAAGERSVSSGYVNAMTTFINQFLSMCIARDLIAFRDHANRKTLSEEDVILISRKTKYHDHLIEYLEDLGFSPKNQQRTRKKKI